MSSKVSEIISISLAKQQEVSSLLDKLKDIDSVEERFSSFLTIVEISHLYSPRVIEFLADHLQLLDNTMLLDQFSLEDIQKLYLSLYKNHLFDLGYFRSYLHFGINVLNKKSFKREIKKRIRLLDSEKQALEKIYSQIK